MAAAIFWGIAELNDGSEWVLVPGCLQDRRLSYASHDVMGRSLLSWIKAQNRVFAKDLLQARLSEALSRCKSPLGRHVKILGGRLWEERNEVLSAQRVGHCPLVVQK